MSVYELEEGYSLFDNTSFGPLVDAYLDEQAKAVQRALKASDCLIEMGCGKAENIGLAVQAGVHYVGVDPSSNYIDAARRIGDQTYPGKARFVNCGAEQSDLWQSAIFEGSKAPFLLMPFNCFGNVTSPQQVLASLAKFDGRSLLSVFSDSDEASLARETYYQKAGFEVRSYKSSWGRVYESASGFCSIGFRPASLMEAAIGNGLRGIRIKSLGQVGLALMFGDSRDVD